MNHLRLAPPPTQEFHPHETVLTINNPSAYQLFSEAILMKHRQTFEECAKVSLSSAFDALRTGLMAISALPGHVEDNISDVSLARHDENGIHKLHIEHLSGHEIKEIMRIDFLENEYDTVVNAFRQPGFFDLIRRRPPQLTEVVHLKSDRTKRHEHTELSKQE